MLTVMVYIATIVATVVIVCDLLFRVVSKPNIQSKFTLEQREALVFPALITGLASFLLPYIVIIIAFIYAAQ